MKYPPMRLASIAALIMMVVGVGVSAGGSADAGTVPAPRGRAMRADDFDRMVDVASPVCSLDGQWVAYTVEAPDVEADERKSAIWMVDFAGNPPRRLTTPAESATKPAFSPDGRYVSFVSDRDSESHQLFLLDRQRGQVTALPHTTGDIAAYAWSPDGGRLVISMTPQVAPPKNPQPVVIDRMHFKQDGSGYLTAADRTRLFLYDLTTKTLQPLTGDARYDDTLPIWSPDGRQIAFVSNRGPDADLSGRMEVYLIDAQAGATPRKLAEFFAPNYPSLLFTREGKQLVYSSGFEARLSSYIEDQLSTVSVPDGRVHVLAEQVDRGLSLPVRGTDPGTLEAILEDDGNDVPVSVRLDTGELRRLVAGKLSTTGICSGGGHTVVAAATDAQPAELYALEGGGLRKLTTHNDVLMTELSLSPVEDIAFASGDGTLIHGMLVKPADYRAGRTYPLLVWLHGGPVGQDSHGLSFSDYSPTLERQWFAAHGYAVLAVNYRGSSGRGAAFARAIAADWGNKEVADLLAGVDHLIHRGIADPKRLGIGGWSYGGLLTDYAIASDTRFKAASSGAGAGNALASYGTDEYILQYNAELGPPWQDTDRWVHLSYPFLHADRIKTPTLFFGGDKDFNVPISGSEQMYQALRTLGVPAQLVIYPGENHVPRRPSFIKDRMQRNLAWFDRYLAP